MTKFAHPGDNVTGFSNFDSGMGGKWLQVLREIVPQRTQFVSMFNPNQTIQLRAFPTFDRRSCTLP